MPVVREWSFNARIRNAGSMTVWSPTHPDAQIAPGGDTLVQHFGKNVKRTRFRHRDEDRSAVAITICSLRVVPSRWAAVLDGALPPVAVDLAERQRRRLDRPLRSVGQRDPLVAGTQVDILRHLLKNAEYDDTFTLSRQQQVQTHTDKPQPARPKNVEAAIKALNETHLSARSIWSKVCKPL